MARSWCPGEYRTARDGKLELLRAKAFRSRVESLSMTVTSETLAVLWLGAGAVALWRLLPAVLNALGLTCRRSLIDDDAAALEPWGDDAAYEDLFGQLRRLGFAPVGRRSTTCWFFLHHWYRNFQSRVFTLPHGDC